MSKHLPERIGFSCKEAERFPELILIASVSPCNLGCPACPSEIFREMRETTGLDGNTELYIRPEYYQKITEECVAFSTSGFTPRIRISGYGEPMLHKSMAEMIVFSCTKGVKTSLINNGTRMFPDLARRMIEAGVESVEFSVDAHNSVLYDKVRPPISKKVPSGNFKILLENIRTFIKFRDEIQKDWPKSRRTFVIASVVSGPQNRRFVQEISDFWLGVGVDHVSVRKFLTWGIPQLEEMQAGLKEKTYLNEDSPCPYPFERCMVDPGGFIRLCPYDDQKNIPPFGHMANTSIAEAWQSIRWNSIRSCHGTTFNKEKATADAPLCSGCQDRKNRSWRHNYLSIAAGQES